MSNRYWVGGTGTWNGTSTTNWSTATGLSFTASCTGTVLTTTGSPALVAGMTVWSSTFVSLGTVVSGSANTWVVSVGGTYASQGMSAATVGASVPTSADNVFFDANSNSSTTAFTVTMATVAAVCADLDASAVDGTLTLAGTVALDVYGSFSLPPTSRFIRSYSGLTTFRATTSGKTLSFNGANLNNAVFDGVGGGWALSNAFLTFGSTTLTNGSLDLNGFTLTSFSFISTNSNARTLAFNGGSINLTANVTGSSATLWGCATATNFTITGTPTVNSTADSTSGTRTFSHGNTAGGSENNTINLTILLGSNSANLMTVQGVYKNLNFSSISSTLNNSARTIYGNLTISNNMTLTAGTNGTTFSGANATQLIISGGLNFDFPVNFGYQFSTTAATGNGTTATLTFASTSNIPAVGSTIVVAGVTPAGYNGTYTVTASTNTTVSYLNATTAAQTVAGTIVNGGSTTYTLQDALSVGTSTSRTITLNTGTLNLNNFTLTNFGLWASNNINTRAIAFGTGNYTNTYAVASATVWGMQTITGFTYTGTPTVNITGNLIGAFIRIIQHGSTAGATESNSPSFNITNGADSVTLSGSGLNVNTTGFSGSLGSFAWTTYGNFTLGSTTTVASGTSVFAFASTNATTRTITTNGVNIDRPITFNGVGGSWQLQDALTVGTTRTLGLTNGSFNSGNQSITTGLFNFSNSNTKTLTLGTSTVTITGGTSTSGFIGSNSGTTYDVVNSTIVFTNTGAFAGGSGGSAGTQFGTITMSAASGTLYLGTTGTTTARCTTLNNTVSPCTITNACTTGFTVDNFNINGTAGNLVTLNSTVAGTARTISKSSGTVSANYLSIQDSTATGGATWNAYASTNVSNNTGWNFLSLNQGNFLMLF